MRLLGLAAVALAAVSLGIVAAVGAFGGGSQPRVVKGAPSPPGPAELRTIERLALNAASGAGDAHPTDGVVVPSTRLIAERVDAGAVVDSNPPVYFVLLHGHFTSNMAPPGGTAPRGTILTLTIDPRTNESLDSGIGDRIPNLDAIGKPESLPLSNPIAKSARVALRYSAEGVTLTAAPPGYRPRVSRSAVFALLRRTGLAGSDNQGRPTVRLWTVRADHPYPAWVLTFHHTRPTSYGIGSVPEKADCTWVLIYDLRTRVWTEDFQNCPEGATRAPS